MNGTSSCADRIRRRLPHIWVVNIGVWLVWLFFHTTVSMGGELWVFGAWVGQTSSFVLFLLVAVTGVALNSLLAWFDRQCRFLALVLLLLYLGPVAYWIFA